MPFTKKRIKQLRKKVRNVKKRTNFRRQYSGENIKGIRKWNERRARRAIIISEEIHAYWKKLPRNIPRKLRDIIIGLSYAQGNDTSAGNFAKQLRDWIRSAGTGGRQKTLNYIRKYAKPALILCTKYPFYYVRVPAEEALQWLEYYGRSDRK